ncbi:MAG: hypothetical protein ABEI96_03740 [Haloarculaceae archaeon]
MNRILAGGLALLAVGVVGYAVGVGTSYPGRAFSVSFVMIGTTVAAIGTSLGGEP